MRTPNVKAAALVALVALTALVSAQPQEGKRNTGGGEGQAAKPTSKLELALEAALKSNPDLRVAAAKAALAEAELVQARLQVARKVVTAQAAAEGARSAVGAAAAQAEQVRTRHAAGRASNEEMIAAQQSVVQARTKQAAADAELDYLLGKGPGRPAGLSRVDLKLSRSQVLYDTRFLPRVQQATVKVDAAAKIRKALERKMTVKVVNTASSGVLELVRQAAPGLHIQAPGSGTEARWNTLLTATLTDVPISAVLQLLEDSTESRVVVRDYGLLIVAEGKVPPGAVLLSDFLKAAEAKTQEKKDEAKKP